MSKEKQSWLYRRFKSPIKGIFDIVIVMAIVTLAVVFLGPVILQQVDEHAEAGSNAVEFEYMCPRTGLPTKDYLIDEQGNVYGRIDIEYHDNGAFRQITEHNERDNRIVKVFYSEDNEFLYWIEIQLGEHGEIISSQTFSSDGSLITN